MSRPAIPLRIRKPIQARLALLHAATQRLDEAPLARLSVAALCDEAGVSEATFYNYFPAKSDLVGFAARLWELELLWHGRRALEAGLAAIHGVFDHHARRGGQRPGLVTELAVHQARGHDPGPALTPETCRLAYPDLEDVEVLAEDRLDQLLADHLNHAVERGELPPNTHAPTVLAALGVLFHGVPVALGRGRAGAWTEAYRRQLTLLWAGVHGAAGP